ncbi:MAG: phosphatase PAP2 family protein [Anaerolineae bacterium]|nr:phosphatase PAP2 family protein [Anaerolineae bacterium]
MIKKECRTQQHPSLAMTLDAVLKPSTRGEYLAYGISQVGSPPVMGLLGLIFIAASMTVPGVWLWSGVYVMMAMVAPLLFLVWQVRHGRVTDLDVQFREQRKGSLLVTIAGFGVSWLAMHIGHAPPLLKAMAGAGFVQWLIVFAITLRWKISAHTSSAAGVTMLILRVFGLAAAPLVISIPLIAWSRVKLRRHTLGQTVAGAVLGCVVIVGAILLTPAL